MCVTGEQYKSPLCCINFSVKLFELEQWKRVVIIERIHTFTGDTRVCSYCQFLKSIFLRARKALAHQNLFVTLDG